MSLRAAHPNSPEGRDCCKRVVTSLTAVIAIALAGCGGGFGGDFGATQGGVQDMGLARELIANGQVPPAEAFVVEGMFSEHDLGLTGDSCATLLCLRGAVAMAPTLDGETAGWMQLGLSSTIDPDTYQRPSITIIATVDVSGSMGWGYQGGEYPSPGMVARALLKKIVPNLGQDDRVAIVTYGSDVSTALGLTNGSDQAKILGVIDGLSANGSTNMEAGMRRAYDLARTATETEQVRVMLFTDVQPNVGATSASEFQTIASAGAEDGIGLTVFGVGLGLGQEVMNGMSHLRGGNAFSLFKMEHIDEIMDDSWPWMVSPIAYNLKLKVTSTVGYSVTGSFGFPASADDTNPELDVATVFLSKRKGALLVQLRPDDLGAVEGFSASISFSYEDREGNRVEQTVSGTYSGEQDERGHYYEQPGTAKTVALALLVSAMKAAAELYPNDQAAAVEVMTAAHARFAADAEALADPALTVEVDLAAALLDLMQQGAPQGDLY